MKNIFFTALFSLLFCLLSQNLSAHAIDFSEVVANVKNAVVEINATQKTQAAKTKNFSGNYNGNDLHDIIKHFFENPIVQQEREVIKTGTGFFISADGFIVTNHHIIKDASEIEIVLHDKSKVKAKIIGQNKDTDLAVLKIEKPGNFEFIEFADSAAVKIGDPILVIGNALGIGLSATSGIVSAVSKNIGFGPYDDFLQIDAPINSGNSGGPVLNTEGKVLGISSMYVYSVGVSGMGFAISANLAKIVTDQLIAKGYFERGYMGVKVQNITDSISQTYQGTKGVMVVEIEDDGVAKKAGVKVGDLIISFNGEKIDNINELNRQVLYNSSMSDKAKIEVLRFDGEKLEKLSFSMNMIKKNESDEERKIGKNEENRCFDGSIEILPSICGKNVADIAGNLKERFNVKTKHGILIYQILDEKISQKSQLLPGDVIESYFGKKISKISDLQKIIKNLHDQDFITLLINRAGNNLFIGLSLK